MEIGNALPYRKKSSQELFGSVIPIKSVMAIAAGNFFWGGFSALRPSPPSNGGQSVIRARACTLSRENSLFRYKIRGQNYSGKKMEIGVIQVKIGIQN